MSDSNVLFSIVVPCHNGDRWITEALESCLRQTYSPLEVVLVDDGSQDKSRELMRRYVQRWPNVFQLVLQSHMGAPVARSSGYRQSKGEYILFLDADDRLSADGLHTLAAGMALGGDISYGRAVWMDEQGQALGRREQDPQEPTDSFINMFERHPITSSVAFRRHVIAACPWQPHLPCAQEYDLLIRCALNNYKFRFMPSDVAEIRQHASPERITNRTSGYLPSVAAELRLGYRQQLAEKGALNAARSSAINYALLSDAIILFRRGQIQEGRNLISKVDRRSARRSPRFQYLSYAGIASTTGLWFSHKVWEVAKQLRIGQNISTLNKAK